MPQWAQLEYESDVWLGENLAVRDSGFAQVEEVGAVTVRENELDRLRNAPLHMQQRTFLIEPEPRLLDGPSFVPQFEEIFVSEIYDFPFSAESPVIIDGGANIGLATIWWKARWPKARVIAFEPDPYVFEVLKYNLRFHHDVKLHQAALSTPALGSRFISEGTDAGRLGAPDEKVGKETVVPTVSLNDVLSELDHVDLLKLDIEGAETEVMYSIRDQLDKIDRIFVEYHSFVGQRQTFADLMELLRGADRRIAISTPVSPVRPFKGVAADRGIDVQCNIWAWRETADLAMIQPVEGVNDSRL